MLTDTGGIMSEPEACANCRFYRPHPNFVPAGHCHRRAPERGYLDCGAWPSVPGEEWCGEWEAKKAAVPTDGRAEQPAGAIREGGDACTG